MKTKESFVENLVHKAAQSIVHRERYGWPPDTPWGGYQPLRPEKVPDPQEKSKENM